MMPFTRHTLKKAERLSSKTGLTALLSKGKWGVQGPLRYCCLPDNGQEQARIVVSVPKKMFRRAVKRNLLKRRIRESYRTQKALLEGSRVDLMFVYSSKEVLDSAVIREAVGAILTTVAGSFHQNHPQE
jgi:ribonuclease P protein component